MEQEDWVGTTVYDAAGKEVGRVERAYPDGSGAVRYVRVKMGTLFARHRLVPADSSERTDAGLKLPYSKDTIESSPDLPDDVDPLSGMVSEDLRGYYTAGTTEAPPREASGGTAARPAADSAPAEPAPTSVETTASAPADRSTEAMAANAQQVGGIRDSGDVVEIPVTEERLVKQPVVTEVIRVRKTAVPETETVSAEIRKEDVEVESQGDAPIAGSGGEAESPPRP